MVARIGILRKHESEKAAKLAKRQAARKAEIERIRIELEASEAQREQAEIELARIHEEALEAQREQAEVQKAAAAELLGESITVSIDGSSGTEPDVDSIEAMVAENPEEMKALDGRRMQLEQIKVHEQSTPGVCKSSEVDKASPEKSSSQSSLQQQAHGPRTIDERRPLPEKAHSLNVVNKKASQQDGKTSNESKHGLIKRTVTAASKILPPHSSEKLQERRLRLETLLKNENLRIQDLEGERVRMRVAGLRSYYELKQLFEAQKEHLSATTFSMLGLAEYYTQDGSRWHDFSVRIAQSLQDIQAENIAHQGHPELLRRLDLDTVIQCSDDILQAVRYMELISKAKEEYWNWHSEELRFWFRAARSSAHSVRVLIKYLRYDMNLGAEYQNCYAYRAYGLSNSLKFSNYADALKDTWEAMRALIVYQPPKPYLGVLKSREKTSRKGTLEVVATNRYLSLFNRFAKMERDWQQVSRSFPYGFERYFYFRWVRASSLMEKYRFRILWPLWSSMGKTDGVLKLIFDYRAGLDKESVKSNKRLHEQLSDLLTCIQETRITLESVQKVVYLYAKRKEEEGVLTGMAERLQQYIEKTIQIEEFEARRRRRAPCVGGLLSSDAGRLKSTGSRSVITRRTGTQGISLKHTENGEPPRVKSFRAVKRVSARQRPFSQPGEVSSIPKESGSSPEKPSGILVSWKPTSLEMKAQKRHGTLTSRSTKGLTSEEKPYSRKVTPSHQKRTDAHDDSPFDILATHPVETKPPRRRSPRGSSRRKEAKKGKSLTDELRGNLENTTHDDARKPGVLRLRESSRLQAPLTVCSVGEEDWNANAEEGGPEEGPSSLSFQIPAQSIRDALLAPRNCSSAYWGYQLYRGPGGAKIPLHYCRSKQTTEKVAQLFLGQDVLGFDIEWSPFAKNGIKNNVSLIQLACENRIALFHIALFKGETLEELLAPTLRAILESKSVTKVGVAIKGDCTRLRKFLGIQAQSIFELSHLYKLVKYSEVEPFKVNKRLVSLAQQVEEHLRLPLFKGEVRESDWTRELNWEQCMYAASDAYAGFQLFNVLDAKRQLLYPTPPRPAHAELDLPLQFPGCMDVVAAKKSAEVAEATIELGDLSIGDIDLPAAPCNAASESTRNAYEVPGTASGNGAESVTESVETLGASKKSSELKSVAGPSRIQAVDSPELQRAEAWMTQWRSALPPTYTARASRAYLRAYALWHDQSLDLAAVAKLLRDPPLQLSTVASYVLESVRMERLPFDSKRIEEALRYLPTQVVRTRYRRIRSMLGDG